MFSQIKRKLEGRSHKTPDPTTTTSSVPENRYEVPFFVNAAYYPNWRIYRQQPPSSLRLGFVSHVFYAFAWYSAPYLW